ncbi:MAG: 30S ribosomal protein S1 [Pyrinomonadaceae bacterium]|nr:30S ribosomal protein S1 [Pyrinomonadaceae bacterium]MCX7639883.1 30S ribosomal protein S1 [Pyrinomonadaceae bacterium]MDW8304055.1 30S ribosomal protein S1 [Acidobacteriota bacterium]
MVTEVNEIQSAENQENGQTVEVEVAETPAEDFGAMLQQYEQEQTYFRRGQVVSGRVVGFTENAMMVDFGHKSEGAVNISEVKTPEGELKLKEGDEVEVIILNIDSSDNPPVLSYLEALKRRAWEKISRAFRKKEALKCKVVNKVKGGFTVDIEGVEAFLPGSQIDSRPVKDFEKFIGEELEVKVIRYNRKKGNVVVSRKVITDEILRKQREELFSQIKEGYVVEGTVKSIVDYGVFVDIGGVDGLLHLSEISWEKIEDPSKIFKVGDRIQVKILKINRKKKDKISLGYKQLLPDPWDIVPETYLVGSVVKGKVTSITNYGAFVQLEPGVEGLVHVSEMTWSNRKKHPKNIVSLGQEVEVQVIGLDPKEKRISLSMKNLIPDPWNTVEERYPVGSTVSAVVRKLTEFGAFVEVDDAIEGLVHISEISWKKIKHPKEVLKRKQRIEAQVLRIDHEKKRLSLSIKALQPSAWELFVKDHYVGDVVKGKITRFANFGVFVELAEDLEGLCHISELSEEKVDSPEKVVKIGDELDFKILQIDHAAQKIRLSHRAVKAKEEEEERAEEKSSEKKILINEEARGGIASLGELINLKLGKQAEKIVPKKLDQVSSDESQQSGES